MSIINYVRLCIPLLFLETLKDYSQICTRTMFPSQIQTGFCMNVDPKLDEYTTLKINIILKKYMEYAVKDAAEYCHAAGRNTLTSTDIEYALKYQAHVFIINDTLLDECQKEFYDTVSSSSTHTLWADVEETTDEDDQTTDEDDDEEFTRCDCSDNEKINKMNDYFDQWELWKPDDSIYQSIKKSIDRTFHPISPVI